MIEKVPPPTFDAGETWDVYTDELLDWGAENFLRRIEYIAYVEKNCRTQELRND